MEDVALFGILFRIVIATLALVFALGTLYLINWLTGNRFGAAYDKMAAEAGLPFAVYRAALLIAVFGLYGKAIG
jgi:hypothetical protein